MSDNELQSAIRRGYAIISDETKHGAINYSCEGSYQKYCWDAQITRIQSRKVGRTNNWIIQVWKPFHYPFTSQEKCFLGSHEQTGMDFNFWNWYAESKYVCDAKTAKNIAKNIVEYFLNSEHIILLLAN